MRLWTLALITISLLSAAQPQDDKRLVFSTFHGGDKSDIASAVAVDSSGYIYVTGQTNSTDLKMTPLGGKPLTSAVTYAFLTRYAPGGKEIIWRTQIGGSSNTTGNALAVDKDGNVYLAGTTGARDLPLVNPVQDKQPGLNIAFVMKLSPEGKLLFSTYFGGERNEEALALAVDSKGSIYIAGRATSTTLPVKNALHSTIGGGGQDAFIAKYTSDYKLEYATYFGGTDGTDKINSIAIGPDDALYVTGETMSPGMATENAWIRQNQSWSSFLAKIPSAGDRVEYFTYLGFRGGYTTAQAVAVDWQGRAYVSGYTSVKEMPTTEGAIQPSFAGGMRDAFVLRMNADGSRPEYLTYLGGQFNGTTDPDETAPALAIDGHGHVYVAGETSSSDFKVSRSLQSDAGGLADAWLARLDLDNSKIIYSTFWAGGKKDSALALALGPGENVTVVGETSSANLPLAAAMQKTIGQSNDGFVAQFCDPWPGASAGSLSFGWTQATPLPDAQTVDVWSGCQQKFPVTEVKSDQPWLNVTADGGTLSLKLTATVAPGDLAPGQYTANVQLTIPDAYNQTLTIPVSLTVVEPPPPPPADESTQG